MPVFSRIAARVVDPSPARTDSAPLEAGQPVADGESRARQHCRPPQRGITPGERPWAALIGHLRVGGVPLSRPQGRGPSREVRDQD